MSLEPGAGPLTAATPVRFRDDLPSAADVVVIGGGVIGIFTALYAVRAGLRVVVCEKGRIAAEQSSRNWGWIRQQGRDPDELPIMMEAIQLWQDVDAELEGATGFERQGATYLASTESELEEVSEWLNVARDHDLDTQLLSKTQIAALVDREGEDRPHEWVGAIHTASDGRGEPWQAVPAVARLAQRDGARIREDCAVRTLDISGGEITGVHTEAGLIRTRQVVLAAGAWSSLFARRHGISIPQLSVRATAARTAQLPEFLGGNAVDGQLGFRRRNDGGYTIAAADRHDHFIGPDSFRHLFRFLPLARRTAGHRYHLKAPEDFPDGWRTRRSWAADETSPFERMRVLDPRPDLRSVSRARTLFAKRFPSIGEPDILNAWAGMIDTAPDVVPIVDRVAALEGLIVATGMSGHGFGIGPGFGKILARLAAGKSTGHDLSRFRFSRFAEGSELRLGPI